MLVKENNMSETIRFTGIRVDVRPGNNKEEQMQNVEKAIKILKKKLEKDDVLRIIKERRYYTKPSALKREQAKKRHNNKRK